MHLSARVAEAAGTLVALLLSGATRASTVTWELSGTFSCEYYYNKSTQSGIGISTIDYQTLRIAPGLRYEFTRDFYLEGSYAFTRIYNNAANSTSLGGITTNGPSHTTATRNQFMLSLTYKHRMLE